MMTRSSSFETPRSETSVLLKFIRTYQQTQNKILRKAIASAYKALFNHIDIPINTLIGKGFMMPHPIGIVLDAGVKIGMNCSVLQNVTVQGACVFEDCVEIGANAVILGPLTIGKGSSVGAGAVVTKDVPPFHVAVGVPAKFYPNLKRYPERFSR